MQLLAGVLSGVGEEEGCRVLCLASQRWSARELVLVMTWPSFYRETRLKWVSGYSVGISI